VILVIAVGATTAIVLSAGIIDWLACESGPSAACDRQSLAHAQYVTGWVAAGALVTAAALQFWRSRATAVSALALATAIVIVWALMADAAVHGWDDLKLLPFSVRAG